MRHLGLLQFGLVIGLMSQPAFLQAAEIKSRSSITAVTVFPSGAQITREFSVDIPLGSHEVILNDLPARLQSRSLRVEGAGPEALEIGTIDHKLVTIPLDQQTNKALIDQLQTQLDQLRDQKQAVKAEVEAAQLQKKLLNEMTMIPSRQMGDGRDAGLQDVTGQYTNLYTMMGEKFIEAQNKILQADVKLRAIEKEIANVRQRLAEQPKGNKQATRLVVNLTAANQGKAKFKVHYQVSGAGWRPLYEARLSTNAGQKAKLDLVRRASVFQTTSEDWDNIVLTLSTTNPTGRTKAPGLSPLFVDFRPEPKPLTQGGVMDMMQEESDKAKFQGSRSLKKKSGRIVKTMAMEAPARPRRAQVSFGAYQMTFKVVEPTTVKRDGERKKVFLDQMSVAPKVSLFAVPKKERRAYLHGSFTNTTQAAILAGQMSLFRDGVYIGRSHLKAVEPGQKVEIGFGVDPKVNVKWVRLDRVKGETGLISTSNSDVHRYKITLTNGHKMAMPVTILDQMPYANQETLEISLLNANPKPSRQNVEDKKGIMAWDLVAQPNKPITIDFGYQLVWPKDKKITLR